ncbi:MAG: NarK family nitrate/nitrite MFS transporter [Actinobacteria bacterium]|nr:NarK family nitrate/nitrite MFS transporter [Actinomycetota bacterium]
MQPLPDSPADVAAGIAAGPGAGGNQARRAFTQAGSMFHFSGKYRVLHLTWFAFFLSFVVWMNLPPFAKTIGDQFQLSKGQVTTLVICNLALTVPARISIGMALDRFGPRRVYSAILVYAAIPTLMFAWASSFQMMVISRLLLSIVGAGFVVGIRMVSEWFPPRELGTAEGMYGGWGNFGAAAAAFSLPIIAGFFAVDGWRWAMTFTGIASALYGLYYLRAVHDTPEGVTYVKPRRQGALEVTNRAAVFGLAALTVPVWAVLALIAWRVMDAGAIGGAGFAAAVVATAAILAWQLVTVFKVNRPARLNSYAKDDQYPFRSVAVLCIAYFCTFGAELAVVGMLPQFFDDTWKVGTVMAGMAGSTAAILNLVTRPAGGLFSDLLGNRRRTLRVILVGFTLGYLLMATLGPAWPLWGAIVVSLVASIFGQAGNGAVYAIVPLIKKRVSGQTAGIAGAYGNIGGVVFVALLAPLGARGFFIVIAACGALGLLATRWLVEPAQSFSADLLADAAAPIDLGAPTRETRPADLPAPVPVPGA